MSRSSRRKLKRTVDKHSRVNFAKPRDHRRVLQFEPLEDRRMLAGVTLVTHGFLPDVATLPTWTSAMSNEIAERIVLEHNKQSEESRTVNEVAQFRMDINHVTGIPYVQSFNYWNGYSPAPSIDSFVDAVESSLDGEVVITLDWSNAAGIIGLTGVAEVPTGLIADKVTNYLGSTEIGKKLLELPMHLVGHSRGASVVGAIAENLAGEGVWIDHATLLDAHPIAGLPLVQFDDDWGDTGMIVPANVVFADSYYREGGLFIPNGESVSGAYNVELNNDRFSGGSIGYSSVLHFDEHSDVHLWYHGTVGTEDGFSDGEETVDAEQTKSVWFKSDAYLSADGVIPSSRSNTGYAYSRIVGNDRPAWGLSQEFGGWANRQYVNSSGDWANIGYLNLVVTAATPGSMFDVNYKFDVPSGESATVSFYLDDNQNPYDGHLGELGSDSVSHSANKSEYRELTVPNGTTPDSYYVYGKIERADTGTTRYFYAEETLGIAEQLFTLTASAGPNGAISPIGAVSVAAGGSIGFHATPDPGYQVNTWKVNGIEQTSYHGLDDFFKTNVSGPITVSVNFTSTSSGAGANDTWQTASNLGTVEGEHSWSNLAITSEDVDFYRFVMTSRGTPEHYVEIWIDGSGEDNSNLDIALGRVSNGSAFKPATGVWGNVTSKYQDTNPDNHLDRLSLDDFGPGEYYLIVYGGSGLDSTEQNSNTLVNFVGTESANYSLDIVAPMADGYEVDDVAIQASVIRTDSIVQHHSLPKNDEDWAKFTLSQTSNVVIDTEILIGDFNGVIANLSLELYGPESSTTLIASDSDGDGEAMIRREGGNYLEPGTYYVKVTSYDSNNIQDYALKVNAVGFDGQAPEGAVQIASAKEFDGNFGTLDATVLSIDPYASDNSGTVADMRYSYDGTNWKDWQNYSSSSFDVTLPQSLIDSSGGSTSIYMQYRDAAGNLSATYSDTLVFTSLPPVVTTLEDTIIADGFTSLREAILVSALNSSGPVTFDPALYSTEPGTLLLAGYPIELDHAVDIEGPGADHIAIDANQQSRAFYINGESENYKIAGLTITNGLGRSDGNRRGGGAILSSTSGSLTLEDSVVSFSKVEGEYAGGGGIYSAGPLTITNSAIINNSATGPISFGGGLSSFSDLTVINSTVSSNTATDSGGEAGGIYTGGALSILNSTITGNTARLTGGGIFTYDQPLTVRNSVIANNYAQGGNDDIRVGKATLAIDHSLVGTSDLDATSIASINQGAGNYLDVDPLLRGVMGQNETVTYYLPEADSPLIGAGDTAAAMAAGLTVDQRGKSRFNGAVDIGAVESQLAPELLIGPSPRLEVLEGGSTAITLQLTADPLSTVDVSIGLLSGSSDLSLSTSTLSFDSTNWGMPQTVTLSVIDDPDRFNEELSVFAASSPGLENAYLQIVAIDDDFQTYIVDSLLDVVAADGLLTLREAIEAANTNLSVYDAQPGGEGLQDIISFDEALFVDGQATIHLGGSPLEIVGGLVITGPGREVLAIDANGYSRVLNVDTDAVLGLSAITLQGGIDDAENQDGQGGGILNRGNLQLSSVTVAGNAARLGGGIMNYGTLRISDSIVSGNMAISAKGDGHPYSPSYEQKGGGIYNQGTLEISSNTAVTGNASVFDFSSGNNPYHIEGQGGGVYNSWGLLNVRDSTISNNESLYLRDGAGTGAIHNYFGWVSIESSEISQNEASPGILSQHARHFAVTDSIISDNQGFGIFSSDQNLAVVGSLIENNQSTGIESSKGVLTVADSVLSGNGGGIRSDLGNFYPYASDNSEAIITGSVIAGNLGYGFAMRRFDGMVGTISATIVNSVIVGNVPNPEWFTPAGGGLRIDTNIALSVTNSTIADNFGGDESGGVQGEGTLHLANSIVFRNKTLGNPLQANVADSLDITSESVLVGIDPAFIRNPSPGDDGLWGTNDDDYGDLRLAPSSPAIDAGDNTLALNAEGLPLITDLAGDTRVVNETVDIGAHENQLIAFGDFNTDGLVDSQDLSAWKVGFGTSAEGSFADGDSDSDGDIDGRDFLIWQRNLSPEIAPYSAFDIIGDGYDTNLQSGQHIAVIAEDDFVDKQDVDNNGPAIWQEESHIISTAIDRVEGVSLAAIRLSGTLVDLALGHGHSNVPLSRNTYAEEVWRDGEELLAIDQCKAQDLVSCLYESSESDRFDGYATIPGDSEGMQSLEELVDKCLADEEIGARY